MFPSMRHFVKRLLPSAARSGIRRLFPYERPYQDICRTWRRPDIPDLPRAAQEEPTQALHGYESRLFSQNGEDGIIRRLLSRIGASTWSFLEFGFSPYECNCLRLAVKAGYRGLFIDANRKSVRDMRKALRVSGLHNVKAVAAFLTVANLDRIVTRNGLRGEIDIASIDVDGIDYWLWEALTCVSPRMVVIEYNASFGPTLSRTVLYDPAFDRHEKHPSGFYHGASLTALQRLGIKRGYRLIGCDSNGFNAFFLRTDIQVPDLKTLSPSEAFIPSKTRLARGFTEDVQRQTIENIPSVQID